MGLVHYEPQIEDDFSAEVIRLACDRSPDIADWFAARKWISEVSDDEVTPLWLRKRCLTLVMDELADWGIEIHMEPKELIVNPQLVYCILMMLSKFRDDNLKRVFKDHPDCLDTARSEMGPDLFDAIIRWCSHYLPLDDGWELISDTCSDFPGVFGGDNSKFIQYVERVVEAVERLGDPDISYFVDEDLYFKFVQFLLKRQGFVRAYCDMWINRGEEGYQRDSRRFSIDKYLNSGFEKQLANKKSFCKFAERFSHLDFNNLEAVDAFVEDMRQPYRHLWEHDLKFYCCEEKRRCPDSMLAIMISTMIVDCPHQLSLQQAVNEKIEEYADQLGDESVNQLKEAFADLMSNLSKPVEVNYAVD